MQVRVSVNLSFPASDVKATIEEIEKIFSGNYAVQTITCNQIKLYWEQLHDETVSITFMLSQAYVLGDVAYSVYDDVLRRFAKVASDNLSEQSRTYQLCESLQDMTNEVRSYLADNIIAAFTTSRSNSYFPIVQKAKEVAQARNVKFSTAAVEESYIDVVREYLDSWVKSERAEYKDPAQPDEVRVFAPPRNGTKVKDGMYTYTFVIRNGFAGWQLSVNDFNATPIVSNKTVLRNYPVVSMDNLFRDKDLSQPCVLEVLRQLRTGGVLSMSNMFYRATASSPVTIDLQNLDVSNVNKIGSLFYGARLELASIRL